ncbi:hypothetical protein [Rhizobium sp. CIAT894]|uniref:hypothetical protein n=1 Tax=Rhizobium sp. CIAT894 TaxID=2020312 RepID=UPI00031DA030|nr:hypothetical protein [Rhizobium sp. CIAT894]
MLGKLGESFLDFADPDKFRAGEYTGRLLEFRIKIDHWADGAKTGLVSLNGTHVAVSGGHVTSRQV